MTQSITQAKRRILGGFGWNYAIIDVGCNRSVAGKTWSEEFFAALRDKDQKKVVIRDVSNGQKFRCGGGKVFAAKKEIKAPVMIGSKTYSLGWHVVMVLFLW